MEYTKRRNFNRGYMKLHVWQRGMDLVESAYKLARSCSDLKLRSQFVDAVQSVSANVAEGYGRRSLREYIQFLYVAKGSLGEAFTRAAAFHRVRIVSDEEFDCFDELYYEVENKLLALIHSLQTKRADGDWTDALPSGSRVGLTHNPEIH